MPLVSSFRVTPGSGAVSFSTSSTANATANFVTVTQSTASIVSSSSGNSNTTSLPGYLTEVTANSVSTALGIVNVLNFGFVFDNATDNANAVNNLNTYLTSNPNSLVYFPPASLPALTSSCIAMQSNTTLWAYPGSVTIKAKSGTTANPVLLQSVNNVNNYIYGLTFDGNLANNTGNANVITIYQSSQIVFEKCVFQNTCGIALIFSTTILKSGVINCRFYNCGSRWKYTGSSSDQHSAVAFSGTGTDNLNFVRESYFEDTGLDAISATGGIDFSAIDNRFLNVGCGVAGVIGAKLNNGVSNSGLTGGAGVYCSAIIGGIVKGNIVDGAGGNGIDIATSPSFNISDNNCVRNGGSGIGVAYASNITVDANVCKNNNQQKIYVSGASQAGLYLSGLSTPISNVTITGNICFDDQSSKTQTYGLQIQTGSTFSNIIVDYSNNFNNNLTSAYGESATSALPAASLIAAINNAVAYLPTTTPSSSGQLWISNGVLHVS